MSDIAIKVEGLSKRYRIGQHDQYKTLRDTLTQFFKNPRGYARYHWVRREDDLFWALRDVDLQIGHGEVVGIIGRNGAGKSTLLKILSRITSPTTGRIEITGRVGSLLEVGTGFHPELSGRANIFLNGAILGMRRGEIAAKFDEIVAFSEIEKFLDTPVKRYSSGMYLRLAFAVAAHLEPEILLVDEVLAVGDANFQKKCLGKMSDVAKHGRTVLFVSHNMGAITSLTRKTIHLDGGRVKAIGNSDDVVAAYLHAATDGAGAQVSLEAGQGEAFFTGIESLNAAGVPATSLPVTEPFLLRFHYTVTRPLSGLELSFTVLSRFGHRVFSSCMSHDPNTRMDHGPGTYVAEAEVPALFLAPGTFTIRCGLHQPNLRILDVKDDVIRLDIVENGSNVYIYNSDDVGSVLTQFEWRQTRVSSGGVVPG